MVGADDISVDLNGHLIDGDATPAAECRPRKEFCDMGVLSDGHVDVTVRNGSVREFGTGVFVLKARHARVRSISSSRNLFFGFVIAESARSVVRDSSGNGNVAPEGDGIGLFGSRHLRILHNSFRHNAQLGMHVVDSTDTLITGNLFSRNADFGILMEADRNQVRRNRCVRNGACIIVAPGNRNVIAWNRASRDGNGVGIEKGRANVVAHNVIVRARRSGMYLGLDSPPIGGVNTVVRRNLVRESGDDAFRVTESDAHSLLRGNIASGAGAAGFHVASSSATLANNRALRSAGLGIEAVFGVIDGGGNSARHNGDPRQCTNISCS